MLKWRLTALVLMLLVVEAKRRQSRQPVATFAPASSLEEDPELKPKAPERKLQSDESIEGSDIIRPEDFIFTFNYNYTNVTEEQIYAQLSSYEMKILQSPASLDNATYELLSGTDFSTEEARAMWFYTKHKPKDYRLEFPNPRILRIMMRIDPCRGKGDNDLCCEGANEAICEDNTMITSGADIGLAWFMNGFVLHCSEMF